MNYNNDICLEAKKTLSEYKTQFNTLIMVQFCWKGNTCAPETAMQEDGNLVLFNSQLWTPKTGICHSSTHNKGNGRRRAIMQHDGNLVIYDSSNVDLWYTAIHKKGEAPYL